MTYVAPVFRRFVREPWRLFFAAYVLFGVTWMATSPPWSAPDEPAALAKGLDIAHGHVLGKRPDYQFAAPSGVERWYRQTTRIVDLPADLVPPALIPCFAFDSTVDASCLPLDPVAPFNSAPAELASRDPAIGGNDATRLLIARLAIQGPAAAPERVAVTYVGTYQPFSYGIPALAALPATDSTAALYLARLANFIGCATLLGLGLRLTGRGGRPVRWLGAALALTPMLLFCAGTFSSSGPELAAAFCHVTALVEWHREKRLSAPVRRALLASGVVLALARALGPMWIVLFDLTAAIVMSTGLGRDGLRQATTRRWLRTYSVVVGAAVLAGVAWQAIVQPGVGGPIELGDFVHRAFGEFGSQFDQQVGIFGWLDTHMPEPAYQIWAVLGLILVAAGFAAASWSGRALLVLIGLGSLAAIVFVATAIAYPVQSGPQGRWTLPLSLSLPIVASAYVDRHRLASAMWTKLCAAAGLFVIGGVHVLALWTAARRNARGTAAPWWFIGESRWHPPLGWGLWVATIGVAAVLDLCGAINCARGLVESHPHSE